MASKVAQEVVLLHHKLQDPELGSDYYLKTFQTIHGLTMINLPVSMNMCVYVMAYYCLTLSVAGFRIRTLVVPDRDKAVAKDV